MPNPNISTINRLLIVIVALCATSVLAETPRTVTVTGSATTRAEPDIAHIRMAVVQRSPAPAEAQQEAAKVTESTLRLLDKLGVERKHVNTTGTSIRPDYSWNQETREQKLIGYIAERTIQVELQDLAKLGDLFEGAVKAGVNQVQPPVLDSSRRREIHRDALALAANDARTNASTLAKALDAKLGRALEINAAEYMPQPAPMLRMQADTAMAESSGQSYNAGEIRFDARVNVVFELTGS
jgi:uncharacterized protein YggE